MFVRFALMSAVIAAPLSAQQINVEDCATFGDIAQKAVTMRTEGKRARAATRQIKRTYTGDDARFQAAVPLLVDFVYGLPEAQLGDEVGATYVTACKAQG